jgi:hypothetical protein
VDHLVGICKRERGNLCTYILNCRSRRHSLRGHKLDRYEHVNSRCTRIRPEEAAEADLAWRARKRVCCPTLDSLKDTPGLFDVVSQYMLG